MHFLERYWNFVCTPKCIMYYVWSGYILTHLLIYTQRVFIIYMCDCFVHIICIFDTFNLQTAFVLYICTHKTSYICVATTIHVMVVNATRSLHSGIILHYAIHVVWLHFTFILFYVYIYSLIFCWGRYGKDMCNWTKIYIAN